MVECVKKQKKVRRQLTQSSRAFHGGGNSVKGVHYRSWRQKGERRRTVSTVSFHSRQSEEKYLRSRTLNINPTFQRPDSPHVPPRGPGPDRTEPNVLRHAPEDPADTPHTYVSDSLPAVCITPHLNEILLEIVAEGYRRELYLFFNPPGPGCSPSVRRKVFVSGHPRPTLTGQAFQWDTGTFGSTTDR